MTENLIIDLKIKEGVKQQNIGFMKAIELFLCSSEVEKLIYFLAKDTTSNY